jgi:hypothetical protein
MQKLTDMTIDEISLVDDPANEQARVEIVKAKGGKKKFPPKKADPKADAKADDTDSDNEDETSPDGDEGDSEGGETPPEKNLEAKVKKALEHIAARVAQTIAGDSSVDLNAAAEAANMEHEMDIETLSKALESAEAKLATLEKRATDAESALVDAGKVIDAKDAEIAKAKATPAAAAVEPTEEEVLKSLPESIRKRLEAAAAQEVEMQKLRDDTEAKEAIEKAKGLKIGDATVLGPILLRVAKGKSTAEDAGKLEQLLKAAGEVTSKSPLFRSVGTDAGADAGDPETALKGKAEEIRKAKPELSEAQAYSLAMEQNPTLYNDFVAKRRAK